MKPIFGAPFALTLLIAALIAASLAAVLPPGAVHTAAAEEDDTHSAAAQEHADGTEVRSPLFEALEVRADEDAARRAAGAGEDGRPVEAWDRERAFAEMERLRAEIVVLKGLHGAQEELLLWNRERAETGVAPALLPARLCREAPLGAWCPLLPATFGVAARHAAAPADKNPPPNESGNGPTKDVLQ